jgi:hypothetical protein
MILTLLNYSVNRRGDFMTFEQIVTYIIAPVIAAIAAGWGVVKWVIPRIVDAKLEGEKDTRGYSQKKETLEQLSRLSNSAASHQVVAELLANSQDKEEKANEFIRTIVHNGIQDIAKRLAQLENRQSLLTNLITGGKLDEEPIGDYETWKKYKLNNESPTKPAETGGNGE